MTTDGMGNIDWSAYPFIPEFDDPWGDKWALKCERFCNKYVPYVNNAEPMYGDVYKLCELLWKLKVWTP